MTAAVMAATGLSAYAAGVSESRIAPPSGNETIVETQPSGDLSLYSRTCRGMREIYGSVQEIVEEGSIVKMVEQEDGSVWLGNMISQFAAPGWVKAEKKDDMLVINGPQLIYEEYDYDADDGSWLKYFLSPVEIYEYVSDDGELMRSYRVTEDGVFSFNISGNILKESGDGSLILGIVAYREDSGYFFTGYGDNYIVLTLPEDKPVVVPESAEIHESWAMHYFDSHGGENAKFVDIAVDGDDYYIKGIYPSLPDAWIKGTLNGNTITFPNFQFLGPDFEWNYFVYLAGGQLIPSDGDEDVEEAMIDPEGFAMTLEKDGTLYAETNIIFATSPATNPDNANFIGYFEGIYITPQDPSTFTNPVGPDELFMGGFDGMPAAEFNLPALDENGNLLDVNKLYFSLFVNGNIYTFTPDNCQDLEDLGIDTDTTELPYNIGNGFDFFQEGSWHTVYFYGYDSEEVYNLGVQAVYYPEGKDINPENVLKSIIVFVGSEQDPSSVDSTAVAKEVKEVRFFDMQGRQVEKPSQGVFIKKVAYTDGSEKTFKVAVRN